MGLRRGRGQCLHWPQGQTGNGHSMITFAWNRARSVYMYRLLVGLCAFTSRSNQAMLGCTVVCVHPVRDRDNSALGLEYYWAGFWSTQFPRAAHQDCNPKCRHLDNVAGLVRVHGYAQMYKCNCPSVRTVAASAIAIMAGMSSSPPCTLPLRAARRDSVRRAAE